MIHVLAAVIWVCGAFTLQILLFKAARAADLDRPPPSARTPSTSASRVFFPASVVILVFGIWMVIDQPVWAFGQTWIVFGLVVSILSAAVGMAYFGPEGQQLSTLANRARPQRCRGSEPSEAIDPCIANRAAAAPLGDRRHGGQTGGLARSFPSQPHQM